MQRPLVSIIIPVYNGVEYISQAIESALKQDYENCEVIVINDGSNDDGATEEKVLSFGNKVRYYKKENGGVASALNYAINQMKGEYFSWLSHDDFYYPNKISEEITYLQQSKKDEKIVFCNYDILKMEQNQVSHINIEKQFDEELLINNYFSVLTAMIQFGGVLLHKSIFDKYGVFNEKLKTTQDFEFLFRVLKKEKIGFIKKSLYCIRHHSNQGSRTISSHSDDIDEMYCMFLDQIMSDEMKKMFGSEYNYYYRILWMLVSQQNLVKARKKCLTYLKQSIDESQDDINLKEYLFSLTEGKEKEVYIFGAGSYGRRLLFELSVRDIEVKAFIDNNSLQWGKRIENIPCIGVNELKDKKDEVIIFIAVLEMSGIERQLRDNGFTFIYKKKDIECYTMMTPPSKDKILAYFKKD